MKDLYKIPDYDLVGLLANNTDHLTPAQYDFWLSLEQNILVGTRLTQSDRSKAVQLIRSAKKD